MKLHNKKCKKKNPTVSKMIKYFKEIFMGKFIFRYDGISKTGFFSHFKQTKMSNVYETYFFLPDDKHLRIVILERKKNNMIPKIVPALFSGETSMGKFRVRPYSSL